VGRVVEGNCKLVDDSHIEPGEREALYDLLYNFKALPAGRHLWVCGVPGRQYLFNCHNSSWTDKLSDHFAFTFNELMKGGGTGTNYSNRLIERYSSVVRPVHTHIVCDPAHKDFQSMKDMGLISDKYSHAWAGAIRVRDSRGGWVDALKDTIDYAMGERDPQDYVRDIVNGDIVFDVSLVRPMGSLIRGFGGVASGPWALARMLHSVGKTLTESVGLRLTSLILMSLDHDIASCVVAGNVRRSARMSMKHWEDEDIEDFINCKADNNGHWTTNISIIIDSKFLRQMKRKNTHAYKLLRKCVRAMILRGEPGFWNHTLSQQGEPNEVEVTNPCGEIALCPFENCNLGHINLESFVNDERGVLKAFRLMARFLIRATFGDIEDERQHAIVKSNRRIGVGFFGFHGWLVKRGIKFSECHNSHFGVGDTIRGFRKHVRRAAREYAFELRIPEPVKVTTIAPTGTTAKLCGASEGAHPIFGSYYIRRMRVASNSEEIQGYLDRGLKVHKDKDSANTMIVDFICKDRLVQELEDLGLDPDDLIEGATQVDVEDHFAVQALIQREYADNSIAYTANQPAPDCVTTEKDSSGRYFLRVLPNCEDQFEGVVDDLTSVLVRKLPQLKGTTVVTQGSYDNPPYELLTKKQYLKLSKKHGGEISVAIEDCKNGACPIR
jgi:adenosylcobalamin-dependent ribonucleoside-triphosphate reductase